MKSRLAQGSAQEETLIFLHMPKTAGTTMSSILPRSFGRGRVAVLDHDPRTAVPAFASRDEDDRRRLDLIMGHFPYGLHQHVPRPTRYVTFLRDPVERVMSLHRHATRWPDHYLHEAIMTKDLSAADLAESGLSMEVSNGQVRALLGPEAIDRQPQPLPSDALEQVKRTIEDHFLMVGITEAFDRSILLLGHLAGIRHLYYRPRNQAPRRMRQGEPSGSERDRIAAANSLDEALYDWATDRLHRQFQEAFPEGEAALQRFQRRNQHLGAAYDTAWERLGPLLRSVPLIASRRRS